MLNTYLEKVVAIKGRIAYTQDQFRHKSRTQNMRSEQNNLLLSQEFRNEMECQLYKKRIIFIILSATERESIHSYAQHM